MTNTPYVRSKLAQAGLEFFPPLIRKTLLEESGFREEYDLNTNAVISFSDSGVFFQRSDLFEAARKMYSEKSKIEVSDKDGQKWVLDYTNEDEELSGVTLSRGNQDLHLEDFNLFSPNRNIRLSYLDKVSSDFNLPNNAQDKWHEILKSRALHDEEVQAFNNELNDTPVHIARQIIRDLENGRNKICTFVPPSERYFRRLVGEYDGSTSIEDYATKNGRFFFQKLSAWRPYDGFLFSLFLSSHSSLTAEINIDQLDNEDILFAFKYLEKHGDKISQLGAIEVGFRIFRSIPEVEPILISLIKNIRDDEINQNSNGFKLLSALFFRVDGELSRMRLLSEKPVFYRRLAAMSQAALIQRQLSNLNFDINSFCEWAINGRSREFYLQSLTDMRLEPRWNPGYAMESQLKAGFFGRIMIAATKNKENIEEGELSDLVCGDKPGSLNSLSKFPYPYLPGPLEGAESTQNILPKDISECIEKQLNTEEMSPKSFIALVNSAKIFSINKKKAGLAAKILKLGSYHLTNIEERDQLIAILEGLAGVAAVSRSCELANELRILVRKYRRDVQYALTIEEAMSICLVAAASRMDLNEWKDFAGECLTELAFGDLEKNEGKMLQADLKYLCHVVPELWISCGRADAALMAFNSS